MNTTIAALLAVLLLCVSACKQGAGERCQLHEDCAEGYTCVLPSGGTCIIGGTCQEERGAHFCESDEDCTDKLVCQKSSICTEHGQSICAVVELPDMAMPDIAVPNDLAAADLTD